MHGESAFDASELASCLAVLFVGVAASWAGDRGVLRGDLDDWDSPPERLGLQVLEEHAVWEGLELAGELLVSDHLEAEPGIVVLLILLLELSALRLELVELVLQSTEVFNRYEVHAILLSIIQYLVD